MAANLQLKIITPDRIVLDQEVESVTATAIDGELQILPHHQPLITALAIDILRYKHDGHEESAAVLGGLLEVGENVVTVISDTAELGHEIDEAKAHEEASKAEAEKTQKSDKLPYYVGEMALARAMARVKAVQYSKARRRPH